MADLAELGIVVKTDAAKAATDLSNMSKAAAQADKDAQNLNKSSSTLGSTLSGLQQATNRVLQSMSGRTITDFSQQMDKAGSSAEQAATRFQKANQAFSQFGQQIGASSSAVRAATDAYLLSSNKLQALAKDTATVAQAQGVLKEAYKSGQINAAQYVASLKQLEDTHNVGARTAGIFGKSMDSVKSSISGVTKGSLDLIGTLGGLGLAFSAAKILKAADDYNQLQGKIKILTAATNDYAVVSDSLYKISIKTGTALDGNVKLFQQLSLVAKSLGANNNQLVNFIGQFDKLTIINKLDASHLNGTILELSHVLEQGTVKAQQFNRLLLDFPAIGKVISDGLGKPLVEVREEIKKGQLTSKELFDALTKGLADVDAQVEQMPKSLARSITSFQTALSAGFGELLGNSKVIDTLSSSLDFLGKHMDVVTAALTGFALVAIPAALIQLAGLLALLNPIAAALIAAAGVLVYFSGQTKEYKETLERNNETVKKALDIEDQLTKARGSSAVALRQQSVDLADDTIKKIEDTQATINLTKAELERQKALVTKGGYDAFGGQLTQSLGAVMSLNKELENLDKEQQSNQETLNKQIQLIQHGNTVKAEATHATDELSKAEQKAADTLAANLDAVNQDYADQQRLLEARKQGVDVYNKTVDAINAENKARSLGLEEGTKQFDQTVSTILKTEELTQKIKDMDDTQKEASKTQNEYNALLKEMGLLGQDNAGQLANQQIEQFKLTKAYQDASPAFKKYIDGLETMGKNYKDSQVNSEHAANALHQFTQEYKKMIDAQAKPFVQASEDIQRSLSSSIEDGIKNGFKNGENPLKAFANIIKDTLIKTFANVVSASIVGYINPLIAYAATAIRGQTVGNSVSSSLGVGGTGGGASSLLSVASGGKNLFSSFGGSAGLGTSLDAFGATHLGLSAGSSFVGPLQPGVSAVGSLGGTASLSGILGAAGGGALIGGLNLFHGNQTGSTVGGSLGGVGGSLLASSVIGTAAGTAGGAALGAAAGSVVPIVGTIIGAILGSALGGLIGGGQKTVASQFAGQVTNNSLGNLSYGSKGTGTDAAQTISGALNGFLQNLNTLGINTSDGFVRGGTNSKRGNTLNVTTGLAENSQVLKSFAFDPSNQDSVSTAIAQVGVELAKGANVANKSLTIALTNIQTNGRKAEDIINDLNFAANFDNLSQGPKVVGQFETAAKSLLDSFTAGEDTTKRLGLDITKYKDYEAKTINDFFTQVLTPAAALSPLEQQMKDLKATFTDLEAAAKVLGYSMDTLKQQETALTDKMKNDFNSGIQNQILQILDPTSAAIVQLGQDFISLRKDAVAVGGDLTQVDQLYNLKLQAILQQSATDQINTEIKAQQDLAKTTSDTVNNFRTLANTLKSFKNSLLIDSELSPLSPEDRYLQAQSQFNDVATRAKAGDQDAIAQLPDISKAYLQASKDYNGMFAGYLQDFNQVQDTLDRTQAYESQQANIAQAQLDAQNQQISLLSQQLSALNQQTSVISQLAANNNSKPGSSANVGSLITDQALIARNAGGGSVDLNSITNAGVTLRQHWTFATLAGYTGVFNTGLWNAYAKANPSAAAQFNSMVVAAGGHALTFATGGYTPSNEPFLVGENGPELLWNKKPAYVSTAGESKRFMNGAANEGLSEAIRELTAEIRAGNASNVSGIQALHEVLTEVSDGTKETADKLGKAVYKMSAAK